VGIQASKAQFLNQLTNAVLLGNPAQVSLVWFGSKKKVLATE